MTNQSYASETTKRNITWAEVKAHFHLGEHNTVKPLIEPAPHDKHIDMSDAELVASLNRKYNPAEIEEAYQQEEEEDAPDPVLSKYYPAPYYVKNNCLGYVKHTNEKFGPHLRYVEKQRCSPRNDSFRRLNPNKNNTFHALTVR